MTSDTSDRHTELSPRSRRAFLRGAGTGVAAVGAVGPTSAQGTTPGEPQTYTVEMTDELVFDPDSITISPGDTLVWENVGTVGHSVTAYEADIPDEADYFASGGWDDEQSARNGYSVGDPDSGDIAGGETYRHTFEVEGSYEYFCIPHEGVGMVASVEVTPGGSPGGDGGGGGSVIPTLPDSARMLALAASVGLLSALGLTYVFVKYGGDYGPGGSDGGG